MPIKENDNCDILVGIKTDIKGNRFSGCHEGPSKPFPYKNESPGSESLFLIKYYIF